MIHHDKDFLTRLKKRGADRDEEKQFGSWLRASTPNPSRRIVIRVVGFNEDLDEQRSNTEALTRGSAGKDDDDGEFVLDIVSNLPLAASGIRLGPAEVQLGTIDCAVVGTSGQGSEDSRELSKAVDCNDRELAKSDKDEGRE